MSDPLAQLTRAELADLGREYLLAGHMVDRAGMPALISAHGRQLMTEVAIEEWMAASPIYTRRMQRLLGIDGDDVATVFKGMQLDIGAPPEFMDFRYQVDGADRGEFWLDSCGALLDVEPLGDEFVVAMCHHIEDPTFDATALATNGRARVRPLHRPPRTPADRHPHCHWTVTIDPAADLLAEAEATRALARSVAAQLPLAAPWPVPAAGEAAGQSDYAGEFDPDLRLETFAAPTLRAVLDEVCLQGHLLGLGFGAAAETRCGRAEAERLALQQFTGVAGLVARRLASWLSIDSRFGGLDGVAAVLAHHPAFRPSSYVDVQAELDGDALLVRLGPCPAVEEEGVGWIGLLAAGAVEPLAAIVQAVEPRAQVLADGALPSAGAAGVAGWRVTLDRAHEPEGVPVEVQLASLSGGAGFQFSQEGR